MSSTTSNNKRIAKNTLLLYFRMILTMFVTLYTSRVVLNTLGVEDFGIFNVVGGIVVMFSVLNSAMSSATQRFLSFELGQNNKEQFTKVFSMSITIHALIALIIFVLAETIGLWFLNTHLVIPADRLVAANWVYQCSVLSFMVTILSVPYNASIIAYERMGAFAYISILEVSLKLLAVFILQWIMVDKLKLYAVLLLVVALIIRLVYGFYCKLKLEGCKYIWIKDKQLFKTLASYAGWNLWGNLAAVGMDQGVNLLLNIFFGPVVNAARGIAYQAGSAVRLFVSNFQMAVNPQIVKRFASKELKSMHQLIYMSSKYSYFLLLLLGLPVFIETDYILSLWLGQVPKYSVLFLRLVLIIQLIDSLSGPLMTAAQASGKIKVYQSIVGGLLLTIVPVSYLFLAMGYSAAVVFYVNIAVALVALFVRLIIISPLVSFSLKSFIRFVICRVLLVTILLPFIPFCIYQHMAIGLPRFIVVGLSVLISFCFAVYLFGIEKNERQFVKGKIKSFLMF